MHSTLDNNIIRNDFVVNVSHEFKTPIAAIEGYATLLQDKTITKEEHDEYTGMIVNSARQLSTLSGNILKISKLENQEVISDKAAYRLDEQVRQALLLLEPICIINLCGGTIDVRSALGEGSTFTVKLPVE
jgi:signal transduction histidine kinase